MHMSCYINGLIQERCFSALALELCLFFINPSICHMAWLWTMLHEISTEHSLAVTWRQSIIIHIRAHTYTINIRISGQQLSFMIWVRSWRCGCLFTWFCYQMIAKPGNKIAAPLWPDPYQKVISHNMYFLRNSSWIEMAHLDCFQNLHVTWSGCLWKYYFYEW